MIAADDYRFLKDFLYQHSGLSLGTGKDYLLESRLPPVAATFNIAGLPALVSRLRAGATQSLVKAVCDAMTTGETLFFRDTTPFTVFRESLLPEAVARARQKARPVRIWCAACSTGQEPYSVSMILDQETKQMGGVRADILATDYSSPTIARAASGVFNQFEVQRGLPIQLLLKYFTKVEHGFQANPTLRKCITFREGNLLKPFTDAGAFDIIFIRNVLIYFDQATKKDVLERLARQLVPGGCLILGGTENTIGVTDALARQANCPAPVYRRPSDAGGPATVNWSTAA